MLNTLEQNETIINFITDKVVEKLMSNERIMVEEHHTNNDGSYYAHYVETQLLDDITTAVYEKIIDRIKADNEKFVADIEKRLIADVKQKVEEYYDEDAIREKLETVVLDNVERALDKLFSEGDELFNEGGVRRYKRAIELIVKENYHCEKGDLEKWVKEKLDNFQKRTVDDVILEYRDKLKESIRSKVDGLLAKED